MRVFTAGITSSMVTSQYGLSSTLSSPTPSTEATKGPRGYYAGVIPAAHAGLINTVSRRTRLQPKGRSEARAVVKAPALLDLPRARAVGHVLLARGAPHAGARRQRRSLAPDGLRGPGIVHPDPIPEADFTADSKDEKGLKRSGGTVSDQIHRNVRRRSSATVNSSEAHVELL